VAFAEADGVLVPAPNKHLDEQLFDGKLASWLSLDVSISADSSTDI
jgi:hypothetical protein